MRSYLSHAHFPRLLNLLRRTRSLALLLIIAVAAVGPGLLPAKEPIAAIVSVGMTVSDMEGSVVFYSTVLGFKQESDMEVTGSHYERLTGVFGLRMRVLRMKLGGEVIEPTEYLAPRDGRPMPYDSRANDVWHWQTRLLTRDAEAAARTIRADKFRMISPLADTFPSRKLGSSKAFLARDADGHSLLFTER